MVPCNCLVFVPLGVFPLLGLGSFPGSGWFLWGLMVAEGSAMGSSLGRDLFWF